MKGKKSALIFAIVILLTLTTGFLVSCKKEEGEVTALNKVGDMMLGVGERADIDRFVEKEGDGKLSYAVENTQCIDIEDHYVIGVAEGTGVVIVSGGEFTVRIEVTVGKGEKVKVTFSDTTAVYDGTAHNVAVGGLLPEGTIIRFYTPDGGEFNGAINAGTYIVRADVRLPEGYVLDCDDTEAIITVQKASYNLAGVSFPDRKLTYTGEEQAIFIRGVLPEGISVSYEGNRATEVGAYRAKAVFSGENPNYEKIADMICSLTIEPKVFGVAANGFVDTEKTYDGYPFTLAVSDLPEGVSIQYYSDRECATKVSSHTYTSAGIYTCYAQLTVNERIAKNYLFTTETDDIAINEKDEEYVSDPIKAVLTIEKATLKTGELVFRKNGETVETMTYGETLAVGSGNADVVLTVTGEMPYGALQEYKNDLTVAYHTNELSYNDYGNIDSGYYTVTAEYVLPESYRNNYKALEILVGKIRVIPATYSMDSVTFTTDKTEGEANGTAFAFAASGYDDSKVDVRYVYKRNGFEIAEVKHAGEYVVWAVFTLKEDKYNYNSLPTLSLNFTVRPKVIPLSVSFADRTEVYDGTKKTMTIVENTALPENVLVSYENNEFMNAGTYRSTAIFTYEEAGFFEEDYAFKNNGSMVANNTLTATLTIQKANYSAEDVAGITAQTELTYFYGMKLSAVGFEGNDDGFVRWKNGEEEIGTLLTVPENEDYGFFEYTAQYSTEWTSAIQNHNVYEYKCRVTLKKMAIDLTGVTVADQFAQRTDDGPDVLLLFASDADTVKYNAELKTTVEFVSAPLATITVSPKKVGNYKIIGNTVFENVNIYLYNASEYLYQKGTRTLLKYKGNSITVSLPQGTTNIGSRAFDETAVRSITVPETVVSIAEKAFYGATQLQKLTIPDLAVFAGEMIESFGATYPEKLDVVVTSGTSVGERKFAGMRYLTSVRFDMPLLSVGREAFYGCSNLTDFEFIASSLKTIGQNAFSGCRSLTALKLPSLVGETEGSAVALEYYFGTSTEVCNLASVTLISNAPYELASSAFYSPAGKFARLETILLSDQITTIGGAAFRSIQADIDLSSSSLTELQAYAFWGYKGRELLLPNGLTTIGRYAFYEAMNLTSLTIPQNVSTIGDHAFDGCAANIAFETDSVYTEVADQTFCNYAGESVILPIGVVSIGEKAFSNAKNLVNVDLGSSVQTIGEKAFEACASLASISFPSTITTIGSWAFLNCNLLVSVTFNSMNPPTASEKTYDTRGNILTVYIPAGANESAYRTYLQDCGRDGTSTIAFK